jgi:alkylhydroperoxidase family enzyme
MPRLRQVRRDEVTDPIVQYIYQRKYGDKDPVTHPGTATGAPGNWETVFALVPDVFEHAMQGFALWQNPARRLDPILRELALTRIGWACGSQFVFSQHCKVLRGEGATERQIDAIRAWQVADVFSARERSVLAYADCLALDHGRVPDQLFQVLQSHLSDEEIVELTYIASMYVMHACMTRALRLEFDDRDDPVAEVPAPAGFSYQSARTPMILPSR